MTESNFEKEYSQLMGELSSKYVMVLATSLNDIVTARNVTTIIYNNRIYFQTDSIMEKVKQIEKNPNIALCTENYQIQGKARSIGFWNDNPNIEEAYRKIHESAYQKYSGIKTEVIIEIEISRIKKWEYIEGKPFILDINATRKEARREEYKM
ncbi:MAG: hypothetical protein ABSA10_01375 [Anaerolineales bacterium]